MMVTNQAGRPRDDKTEKDVDLLFHNVTIKESEKFPIVVPYRTSFVSLSKTAREWESEIKEWDN